MTINTVGSISGSAKSNYEVTTFAVSGTISSDGSFQFAVGAGTAKGATFQGTIDANGNCTGSWIKIDAGISGTFSGKQTT